MTNTNMDTTEDMTAYTHSAVWYDTLYESLKDYSVEASRVLEIAEQRTGKHPRDMSLLDVACGTGLHLQHLAAWFSKVVGIDLSPQQLEMARKRLPEVNLICADMLTFSLSTPGFLDRNPSFFDVVTCLFSSIGYMRDTEQLEVAIMNLARHRNTGGVIIVEPWLTPDTYDEVVGPPQIPG
ncbi:class I SAM-dependent methyltransferase [Candidatus Saccharibacteria bacterium]|nr:class I SAM-dependent methyltransferase [Candidatus Saccharibacteria bacterium]